MRFESIASGSSGNCIYIGSDSAHILVDAGVSRKRTAQALEESGIALKELDAIFITHEHSDHIAGLPVIAGSTDAPIYATQGTIDRLRAMPQMARIDPDRYEVVWADEKVRLKDLKIEPMRISHDAADPVAYRVMCGGQKACVCTDLGCYDDYTAECLKGSDVLLLAANHDVNMLQVGRYPYPLKKRILGDHGHLSNVSSGQLLSKVLNGHMKGIFLGHLSQENNLPELAFETVRVEIMSSDAGYSPGELPIYVADRKRPSGLVEY